jgi:hypothetical protein
MGILAQDAHFPMGQLGRIGSIKDLELPTIVAG